MKTPLADLIAVSREYGSDPRWVVAGGGNTSLKADDVLYIKASGFPLATIDEGGFARMDRRALADIWAMEFPRGDDSASVAERERMVLSEMMAARLPGEERRPSVETLLHDLLPWPLVVHLHPTLVNGLTCGRNGKQTARDLFGDAKLWIPVVDPGYVLARTIRDALEARSRRGLPSPDYIFLANHGVFVGGDSAEQVRERYRRIDEKLQKHLVRACGSMPEALPWPDDTARLEGALAGYFGTKPAWTFLAGGELDRYLDSGDTALPLTGCLTPDHIVYAGPGAMYLGPGTIGTGGFVDIPAAWEKQAALYQEKWGKPPVVTLLNDGRGIRGALLSTRDERTLKNAVILLENALEVCAYADSFGGPLLLEERFTRFIVNWEVENYRSRMA